MLKTVEAIVGEDGRVRLLEDVDLPRNGRLLVTILDEVSDNEAALLSQDALSDWGREEENATWKHLNAG